MTNIEMSHNQSNPEEQAHLAFKARLDKLTNSIETSLKTYDASLKEGLFEDREGEEEGTGEKRKDEMQKFITSQIVRAEKMKVLLDSGEDIPLTQDEIEGTYTHKNEDGTERKETITLNIEKTLKDFTALYKETDLAIPKDFEDQIKDIWQRNIDLIQEAVEKEGYDYMILSPANLPLETLKEKMKMENGYYESSNFKEGGSFAKAKSQGVDTPRIILVHKTENLKDRSELKKTLGIKAQDTNEANSLSLEDYIIFQRIYFKETGKHLDNDGWTWTPKTKSGARFVYSNWYPGDREQDVYAHDPGNSHAYLGCRPSRYLS